MNHFQKIAFLLFSLLLSTQTFADGDRKGRKGEGHFKKIIEELNLSKDQIAKIKAHRESNKGQIKPLREEAKTLREELNKAFVNGASDGELTSLNTRLKDVRLKMNDIRFSKMLFFKNVLTQDQRVKWQEKKKGFMKNRGKGRRK